MYDHSGVPSVTTTFILGKEPLLNYLIDIHSFNRSSKWGCFNNFRVLCEANTIEAVANKSG